MFLRVLKNILFYILFIPVILLLFHYIWVPQYNFTEYPPFYGSKIHNPYHQQNFRKWKTLGIRSLPIWYKNLSNTFQANHYNQIDSLFYDTTLIISNKLFNKKGFINYSNGVISNDIVVLNSSSFIRRSYPYLKTLNNKQHHINLLKDSTSLIYLKPSIIFKEFDQSHPVFLNNYDGYIADMNIAEATYLWDASLSAGHYISLIAESIPLKDEYTKNKQIRSIYYNPTKKDIYKTLKQHDFITATFPKSITENGKKQIPLRLRKVEADNHDITISCAIPAASIAFIGQNGTMQQLDKDTYLSIYNIKRDDSYIRVEITFKDGVKYYLNPLIKTNRLSQGVDRTLHINKLSTILYRAAGILGLIIIIALILYIKRRTRIEFIEITVDENNKKTKRVKTI